MCNTAPAITSLVEPTQHVVTNSKRSDISLSNAQSTETELNSGNNITDVPPSNNNSCEKKILSDEEPILVTIFNLLPDL